MLVETISSVFSTVQLGANSPNSYTPALITRVCVYQTCIVRIISHVTEMQTLLKKSKPLTKQYISCKWASMGLQGDKSKRWDHDPEALLKWIHSKLLHFSLFSIAWMQQDAVFSTVQFLHLNIQTDSSHTQAEVSIPDLSMLQGKTHGLNIGVETWHKKSLSSSQTVLKKRTLP